MSIDCHCCVRGIGKLRELTEKSSQCKCLCHKQNQSATEGIQHPTSQEHVCRVCGQGILPASLEENIKVYASQDADFYARWHGYWVVFYNKAFVHACRSFDEAAREAVYRRLLGPARNG